MSGEKLFLLLSIALIIVFISFFGQMKNNSQYYAIGMEAENFKNPNANLYVDEYPFSEKFGDRGLDRGREYVELVGEPVRFTYKYKPFLPKDIYVKAVVKDPSDMLISPVGQNRVWEHFSAEGFEDYIKIRQVNGHNLYANNNQTTSSDKKVLDENDLIDLVPQGKTVNLLDSTINKADYSLDQIETIDPSMNEIKTSLRGDFNFYGTFAQNIKLSIDYQKIYLKENIETLHITVKDIEDNSVYRLSEKVESQGRMSLSTTLPKRGVYQVIVTSDILGNSEWLTTNIKVNTDKLVFFGTSTVNSEAEIFTNSPTTKLAEFGWWDLTDPKEIIVKSGNHLEKISSDGDSNLASKSVEIPSGLTAIESPSQTTFSGIYFSISEDSYFEPYKYDFDNNKRADFLITTLGIEHENEWVSITKKFDYKSIADYIFDNSISFEIAPKERDEDVLFYKKLRENRFFKNFEYGDGIELWSKEIGKGIYLSDSKKIEDWLQGQVFDDAKIAVQRNLFINKKVGFMGEKIPDGFDNTMMHNYQADLKGDHDFYVFLEKEMNLNLLVDKGSGKLETFVVDKDGSIVCKKEHDLDYVDSLNMNCANINPSTYLLKIRHLEDQGSYRLKEISVNSNKIVISARIKSGPGQVYYLGSGHQAMGFNADRNIKKIEARSDHKKLREYYIKGNKILTPLDTKDADSLYVHDDNTQINTAYASFSKDSYFDPIDRNVLTYVSDDTDHAIIKIINPLLKEVRVEI